MNIQLATAETFVQNGRIERNGDTFTAFMASFEPNQKNILSIVRMLARTEREDEKTITFNWVNQNITIKCDFVDETFKILN